MGNVKHTFTSAKGDGGDASLVRPSNWNAAHKGAQEILDRTLTLVEVVDTVVETSIYSKSIPAGILGADGGFRLSIGGWMVINNAGVGLVIRVKLGATTVLTSEAYSPDYLSATSRPLWFEVLCLNSAADAQKWIARFVATTGTAVMPWQHVAGGNPADIFRGYAGSSEDTAGALTLNVTIQWPNATAAMNFTKELALLELIPAI